MLVACSSYLHWIKNFICFLQVKFLFILRDKMHLEFIWPQIKSSNINVGILHLTWHR